MNIKDINGGKLIILSKPFDTRGKYLNFFYFLSFFIAGTIFISLVVFDPRSWGVVLFGLVASIVCYIAAYRFLNKSLESEKIFIDKHTLQLIRTGFLKFHRKTYEISKISEFKLLNKPHLPKHPLAGETFDYLGFQAEQAVINELHGDDRLSFTYLGKTISFGENISSWEFEELEGLFYEVTGIYFKRHNKHQKNIE